jgi:hypothetical protein
MAKHSTIVFSSSSFSTIPPLAVGVTTYHLASPSLFMLTKSSERVKSIFSLVILYVVATQPGVITPSFGAKLLIFSYSSFPSFSKVVNGLASPLGAIVRSPNLFSSSFNLTMRPFATTTKATIPKATQIPKFEKISVKPQ